jgi:hypothetical protein
MATATLNRPDIQSDAQCPLVDLTQFASFVADIDLTDQSGFRTQPARFLRVDKVTATTADTLILETLDSHLGGVSRTLTVQAGDTFDAQIVKIKAGSTVLRVTVGW